MKIFNKRFVKLKIVLRTGSQAGLKGCGLGW